MQEILVINPRRVKKGVRKMAKRKRRKAIRRKRTTNPAPKRRYARTYRRKRRRNPSTSRAGKLFSGLNFKQAIADQVPIQIGMFGAKWMEKRFGPAASDLDPASWNAFSYIKGALGGTILAVAINALKRGYGQKVLTGALAQVTNRLVRNELIQKSEWAQAQFGQDDEEYLYVDTDAAPYAASISGMMPVDERHRLSDASMMTPSALGDALEPVGAMGFSDEEDYDDESDFEEYADDYR